MRRRRKLDPFNLPAGFFPQRLDFSHLRWMNDFILLRSQQKHRCRAWDLVQGQLSIPVLGQHARDSQDVLERRDQQRDECAEREQGVFENDGRDLLEAN